MKTRTRLCIWIAGLAATLASAGSSGDEFISLFDGKTLSGWTPMHTDRFSARDGVLRAYGGSGWLRSAKSYKNFEFQAEYRALKKGADSGLLFRCSGDSTPKPPHWPSKAYQLQVIDADSLLMIFGHGALSHFERDVAALQTARKPVGEWQTITLKVVGNRAEAALGGKRVTVSDSIHLDEGYIGLQGENGSFEWRNLKIRELKNK